MPPSSTNRISTTITGKAFPTQSIFQTHLLSQFESSKKITKPSKQHQKPLHIDLVYTDINPVWAGEAVELLQEKKPLLFKSYNPSTEIFRLVRGSTPLHTVVQGWFRRCETSWLVNSTSSSTAAAADGGNKLKLAELDLLEVSSHTLSTLPKGILKAPGLAIQRKRSWIPTVIFESTWIEPGSDDYSGLQLAQADMNEWLVHGNGAVRGVIIVCWAMDKEETVRGDVFLYTLDDQGIPVLRQSEQIYPHQPNTHQAIRLTKDMLFGNDLCQDLSGSDHLELDIDLLRDAAESAMEMMDLTPTT